MPAHSAESAVALILTTIVSVFSLAACDGAGPEEEKEPIGLTFTQRDSLDRTIAELGTYSVSLVDQPVLRGAMKAEVVLEGHRGAMSYGRVGGNPDKEVVVFLLTFDGRTGTEHYHGGAFKPGVRNKSFEGIPTGADSAGTFRGTLYGFFVEGIGDRPEVPVKIVLEGAEDTRKLVIDPEKHTLPARYAFHLNEEDVELVEEGSRLNVQFTAGTSENPELWSSASPYPAYIFRTSASVSAGRAIPGSSIGMPIDKEDRSFDFYVVQLEE